VRTDVQEPDPRHEVPGELAADNEPISIKRALVVNLEVAARKAVELTAGSIHPDRGGRSQQA
jgi:hypothetical protein